MEGVSVMAFFFAAVQLLESSSSLPKCQLWAAFKAQDGLLASHCEGLLASHAKE